jgi:integrase
MSGTLPGGARRTSRTAQSPVGKCLLCGIPHNRHTFAVTTLAGWYRAGADVGARLPLLSTWLGHARPASTYWYLQACPELLGLAAERMTRAQHTRENRQ